MPPSPIVERSTSSTTTRRAAPGRSIWPMCSVDLATIPVCATALAAAKSTDPKDEITRRAAAAQRASSGDDRDPNVLRAGGHRFDERT